LIILFLMLVPGEFYYLDGTLFEMEDGTVVKTAADIRETPWFYYWDEENVEVRFAKNRVRSIGYFSMRVEGRRPPKSYRKAVQRRISGHPVIYSRDGARYLKVRHISPSGRPTEGLPIADYVAEIGVQPKPGAATECAVHMRREQAGSRIGIAFFDLQGKGLFTYFLEIDPAKRRPVKGGHVYTFQLPAAIDVATIGLVEVTPVKVP